LLKVNGSTSDTGFYRFKPGDTAVPGRFHGVVAVSLLMVAVL
jgi:hypothetical protein